MGKFLCIICFLGILALPGCQSRTPAVPSRHIVTGIEILCLQDEDTVHLRYTDPEKMSQYLLYLRTLGPGRKPTENPDDLPHTAFVIRLELLGGGSRTYRQVAHRYLQVDGRPWRTLDPNRAMELYPLLLALPQDLPTP